MQTASAGSQPGWLARFNLKWLHRLLTSSVGRKLVMAATGLLLCGFLVTHLAGNLLLFQGPEAYNAYAEWLHHNELLPLAEVGLFGLFAIHIYLAFVTTWHSAQTRSVPYFRKETKQVGEILQPPPHSYMFLSGVVVLGFLVLHMADMKLQIRPDVVYAEGSAEHFARTLAVLTNPFSKIVYCIGSIFLGLHLSHGFASAFQSLGLAHSKYTRVIRLISILFGLGIGVGFAILPIVVPGLKH